MITIVFVAAFVRWAQRRRARRRLELDVVEVEVVQIEAGEPQGDEAGAERVPTALNT